MQTGQRTQSGEAVEVPQNCDVLMFSQRELAIPGRLVLGSQGDVAQALRLSGDGIDLGFRQPRATVDCLDQRMNW